MSSEAYLFAHITCMSLFYLCKSTWISSQRSLCRRLNLYQNIECSINQQVAPAPDRILLSSTSPPGRRGRQWTHLCGGARLCLGDLWHQNAWLPAQGDHLQAGHRQGWQSQHGGVQEGQLIRASLCDWSI